MTSPPPCASLNCTIKLEHCSINAAHCSLYAFFSSSTWLLSLSSFSSSAILCFLSRFRFALL